MTKLAEATATIGARLSRVSAIAPDRIAIFEGRTTLTYAQLDAHATAIAAGIITAGYPRAGLAALLFAGKAAGVRAIYGAGRSGYAYVPLDAQDPDERLRSILQDCEPVVLLTEGALLDRARALAPAGCTVVDVDRLHSTGEAAALPHVDDDSIAYVLYTSGSTGRPKGVQQTHRNILFFADAYARRLSLGGTDRTTLLYSLSFAAANMDIFGGLLNGATVCAYDIRRDGLAGLADWLDEQKVTVLHAVPTAFRELMRIVEPERMFPHLRAIDLGGEAVFGSDVALMRQHAPKDCVLVNHLAATEASVIAQFDVDSRESFGGDSILPVGSCPDGVRVVIRREDGTDGIPGDVGEIVVASPYVSPGYRGQPELNASAFAPDPDMAGWRRYFSGDLGRLDQNGNLHFLGRRGTRVKVGGRSVDLTEIEAAISAEPGIEKVAVLALGNADATVAERLVAYVVAAVHAEQEPMRMRRRLAARLPSYMLPAEIVFVDALPLTATGKVDRRAIADAPPPPTRRGPPPGTSGVPERAVDPPRDDLERAIAGIFEQLLKVTPIGRDDDFFLLGGDSLSAVELQVRLRDTCGAAPARLIDHSTVAGLATDVRRSRASAPASSQGMPVLVPLREHGTWPPLFLVHGGLGQAFVSPQFLRVLGDDQPVWAIQARGLDGLEEPHKTIEAMANDYLTEIRRVWPRGPYFIGALCGGAFIAIVMARSLRNQGEPVLPLLLFDPPGRPLAQEPFSFGKIVRRIRNRLLLVTFASRLKRRQHLGRNSVRLDDPHFLKAAKHTAMSLKRALAAHEARPYDGPALVLLSQARAESWLVEHLDYLLPGPGERTVVAATHTGLLDMRDPTVAGTLQRYLGLVRDGTKAT